MQVLGAVIAGVVLLESADPAQLARAAADRIEERRERARAAGVALDALAVRTLLAEEREALEAAGFSADLATALTDVTTGSTEGFSSVRAFGFVERRLRAFADAAEAPAVELPDVRQQARAILDDPVFDAHPARPGPFRRAMITFAEWFFSLFAAAASLAAANWRVIAVVAAAVAGGALYFAVRVALRRSRSAGSRRFASVAASETPAPPEARAWLEQARRESAAGRALEAMRLLAVAVLSALRYRGRLPDQPGLTLLESLQHLRRTELEPALDGLIELHERQVYAGRACADADLARAFDLAEAIVSPPAATR